MSVSAINNGLMGIQNAMDSLTQDAKSIRAAAEKDTENPVDDITQPIVNMTSDRLALEASVKVVKAADEILGTIIDIKA